MSFVLVIVLSLLNRLTLKLDQVTYGVFDFFCIGNTLNIITFILTFEERLFDWIRAQLIFSPHLKKLP